MWPHLPPVPWSEKLNFFTSLKMLLHKFQLFWENCFWEDFRRFPLYIPMQNFISHRGPTLPLRTIVWTNLNIHYPKILSQKYKINYIFWLNGFLSRRFLWIFSILIPILKMHPLPQLRFPLPRGPWFKETWIYTTPESFNKSLSFGF